jgi:hypothetical protein
MDEEKFPDYCIVGYFTIALKTLEIKSTVSKTFFQKFDGIARDNKNKIFPVFLIGQLGRCSSTDKKELSGGRILEDVFSMIHIVQRFIGGRIVLVECDDNQYLKKFYEKNGFRHLQDSEENGKTFLQYIKIIH